MVLNMKLILHIINNINWQNSLKWTKTYCNIFKMDRGTDLLFLGTFLQQTSRQILNHAAGV